MIFLGEPYGSCVDPNNVYDAGVYEDMYPHVGYSYSVIIWVSHCNITVKDKIMNPSTQYLFSCDDTETIYWQS